MNTVKSSTSKKIVQMRNQLEKHFYCGRCHKHACQKNQEHANQTCKKEHSNQHHKAERLLSPEIDLVNLGYEAGRDQDGL
jgi:transcription elongation factor Elf1